MAHFSTDQLAVKVDPEKHEIQVWTDDNGRPTHFFSTTLGLADNFGKNSVQTKANFKAYIFRNIVIVKNGDQWGAYRRNG